MYQGKYCDKITFFWTFDEKMSFTEAEFLATEDNWFVPGVSGRIQRADVARYLLKTVEEDLHHQKIVAIAPK